MNNAKQKIEEIKKFFDTPTSQHFRERAFQCIDEQRLSIKNDIIPFIEILNSFSKSYADEAELEKN